MVCCAITNRQKDEFWRLSENQAALVKIGVLGNDDVPVFLGKCPDQPVIGMNKVLGFDVGGAGIKVKNPGYDPVGQVLIAQEFHGEATKSLRSRSAAKARQALRSSRVSSEKSARISSSVMPEARYSSTS